MAVLVIADHDDTHVRETTNKTVTAALALSGAGPVQVPAAGARGSQQTLFLLDRAAAAELPAPLSRPS